MTARTDLEKEKNRQMRHCTLCPRACGADRAGGRTGVCGQTDRITAARAALHYWEEPCISGKEGSISALAGMCSARGLSLQHVKPHGAMYNMAAKDYEMSKAICEAVAEFDPGLIILGLSGSETIRAAKDCGLKTALEVFADRAYEEDGSLVDRRKPGAVIRDEQEAIERVIRMVKEGKVTAVTGKDIPIRADSVCVHGDGEKALLFVEKIKKALSEEGIEIDPAVWLHAAWQSARHI